MGKGSQPQTIHTYGKANQGSSIFILIHHNPGYLKPCPPTPTTSASTAAPPCAAPKPTAKPCPAPNAAAPAPASATSSPSRPNTGPKPGRRCKTKFRPTAAYADQMQQRNKAELQQRIARLKQQAKQPGCGSKEHERLSRQLAEARHKLGQIQRQQYISHTLELS